MLGFAFLRSEISDRQMRANSLECADLSALWSAATCRSLYFARSASIPRAISALNF
jgi:hypothetical protein